MPTATATATTEHHVDVQEEAARLRLYTLIGEGYQAMLDGRESTLEEVEQRIQIMPVSS